MTVMGTYTRQAMRSRLMGTHTGSNLRAGRHTGSQTCTRSRTMRWLSERPLGSEAALRRC